MIKTRTDAAEVTKWRRLFICNDFIEYLLCLYA